MSPNPDFKVTDVSVSAFLAVSMVMTFALYATSVIKTLPCGTDVVSKFLSNFVHADQGHLLTNLFALYALSRVEVKLGSGKFFWLIFSLLVSTTLIEVVLHKFNPGMKCSIGFSGVLFGVATWELVAYNTIDIYLISSIALRVILPSTQDRSVSFVGHAVGAFCGAMIGLIWKKNFPSDVV